MHLKKTIKFVLSLILCLGIIVLSVNLYISPKIQSSTLDSMHFRRQMIASSSELRVPLAVIGNIATHHERNPQLDLSAEMEDAFMKNKNQAALLLDSLVLDAEKMILSNESVPNISLLKYRNTLRQIEQHYENLQSDAEELLKLIAFNPPMAKVEVMNEKVDAFYMTIDHLDRMQSEQETTLLRDIYIFSNFILVIFFMLLFGLSLIILRLMGTQKRFIDASFEALNYQNYQYNNLPCLNPIFKEEKMMVETIKAFFSDQRMRQEIREVLLQFYEVDEVITALFNILSREIHIDRVGVAFIDYEQKQIIAEYGRASYQEVLLGPGFEIDIESTSLSALLNNPKPIITHDLEKAFQLKPHSQALKLLRKEGVRSNLILPLTMGEAVFGFFFMSSTKPHFFNENHRAQGWRIANDIKGILNRAYFTKIILSQVTKSFSELVDQKDNETGDHIQRMVAYTVVIAKGLLRKQIPGYEVDEKFILEIERHAPSHDIGKVGIPDKILKKPGKLTKEEWEVMKEHAEIGRKIFTDLRKNLQVFDDHFYKMSEEIAWCHHEKWDGSGYPRGIKGQAIPLSARIVALADVFDAITSKRVYKSAFDLEPSLEIIKNSAGSHLDPVLVNVFFEFLDEILDIYYDYSQKKGEVID